MATQQISSATSFKNPKLKAIHDVEIDKSGKFKYILIKVHDPDMDREFKYIVRGTSKAGFHGKYTHCPQFPSYGAGYTFFVANCLICIYYLYVMS